MITLAFSCKQIKEFVKLTNWGGTQRLVVKGFPHQSNMHQLYIKRPSFN